jgi:predicted alpha/beta hydrolase
MASPSGSVTQDAARRDIDPFWFRVGDAWCAAFWHEAIIEVDGPRRCAVLLPSMAFEQVRGAYHFRALAKALAAAGISTLRVSFPGTDNSSDHPTPGTTPRSLVPLWLDTVKQAIALARDRASCRQIMVVGRRIGGLIALEALRASASDVLHDIELVLWEPTPSGAQFLREVRARNRLPLAAQPDAPSVNENSTLLTLEQSYVHSVSTIEELSALSLSGPTPDGLVIHNLLSSQDRRVSAAIASWSTPPASTQIIADAAFDLDRWEGLTLPLQTMSVVVGLARRSPVTPERVAQYAAQGSPDLGMPTDDAADERVHTSRTLTLTSPPVREQWVQLGGRGAVVGLLTLPLSSVSDDEVSQAVLLLGTGTDGTAGQGDANVRLARSLAAIGIPVLRLDFSGIGESPTSDIQVENMSYARVRTRDIAVAAQWVKDRFQNAKCTAVGMCTGAFYAIHAAAEGVPLNSVVAINPQLFWDTAAQEDPAVGQRVLSVIIAVAAVKNSSKWSQLLTGRVSMAWARKAFGTVVARVRDVIPRSGETDRFGNGLVRHDLDALFPSRTRFHLVFSHGDLGYHHLMLHGSSRVRALSRSGRIALSYLPEPDHTFSTLAMRAQLEQMVLRTLRE